MWAAIGIVVVALLFDYTVGQTVKPGFASVAVIFAALLGAILWIT